MTFFNDTGLNFQNDYYKAEEVYRPALSPSSKGKFRSFLNESINGKPRNFNLVHMILQEKENEYCEYKNLNVFVGTYNVNGQLPNASLKPWLSTSVPQAPDIYAVGFQELDLSQQAFLFDVTAREHDWAGRVKEALHSNQSYVELKRVRLVGMFLLIYVKEDLVQTIDHTSLDCVTVGTGLLNRMGNKGGVAIRFKIRDSTICFVCSHLAAGSDELARRNQDFQEICKVNFFQHKTLEFQVDMFDHDVLIWLGDLNYRLQDINNSTHLSIDLVKKSCAARDFDRLLEYDQLRQMQAEKHAFQDFVEGAINFLPTYKYDPGTDNWDTSEKCRVPAWTDRILWIGDGVKQLKYISVPALKLSDHKPVMALFSVKVKSINETKYNKVYEMALKEADRLENEYLPQVIVDKTEFRFDNVKFLEPQSQTLTITNTGQVPVQYSFKPKRFDETEFCKPWLLVTPDTFVIKVGEKRELSITVLVDKNSVHGLNTMKEKLEDILVLHLEGGKDIFITVFGNFLPTCFGQSLESLVKSPYPVRSIPVAQLIDLADNVPTAAASAVQLPVNLTVPKELYRLVDHIYKNGLDQPDLIAESGCQSDVLAICEALDTGYPETLPGSIYSVVEALMRFLDSLPEPVIPLSFTDRCLKATSENWFACQKVVKEFPEVNRKVFEYLMKFFKEVIAHSSKNGTNVHTLSALIAPLLFRNVPTGRSAISNAASKYSTQSSCTFIRNFLTFEDFDCD